MALYRYGQEPQQSLVHYIVAITCFSGILTLGQAPRTALRMGVVVMIPASTFFLMQDHPNRLAIAAVQIVVTALLILITAGYHRDFVNLERSRRELAKRQQVTADLAEANRLAAILDPLTGANNRRAILEYLEGTLCEKRDGGPWLALLDLDGFKHINDTYGHAAGDSVLMAVAARIGSAGNVEAFGRLGGDEFAILISGNYNLATAEGILKRLNHAIRQPIEIHNYQLTVACSIGLYRCTGARVGECLERADAALYKAKEARNGSISQFSATDERSLRERRDMVRVFTSADLSQQLSLVYQPIVDGDNARPIAFEALVRWSPDGQRWLPPAAFINLAESTGRIGELTRQVLVKALNECPVWQSECSLSINLSARDILNDDMVVQIGNIVTAAGAPLDRIILEVTETALLSDYNRAAKNLHRLRDMGFRMALDDFGTGQSSLSHVHNLPLDHIKIDQTFARDLIRSERSRAVVSSILSLARKLGLECTIEGIETAEQHVAARALGVRVMQGYLFGRPMGAREALSMLADSRSAKVA